MRAKQKKAEKAKKLEGKKAMRQRQERHPRRGGCDVDMSRARTAHTKKLYIKKAKIGYAMVLFTKVGTFVMLLIICTLILLQMQLAKGGKTFKVRTISALEAIEEAIGRAVEMGRPVFVIPGGRLTSTKASETLAAMSIVQHVARLTAKNDARLIIPMNQHQTFPIIQELVKDIYQAENPEAYDPDCVRFLSVGQMSFTAGVMGLYQREKVAANIIVGAFSGETLLLAESGHTAGAIQIGGMGTNTNLTFLAIVCDHMMIGEELMAAGAFLSEDQMQLGSIAGQDHSKLFAIGIIIAGVILQGFFNVSIIGELLGM